MPVTGPPLNVRPVVPPAASTLVTVPVPAPMAVRKVVASSVLTVLFALIRGKVTALGFVRVKKLSPTVVEPRPVRAALVVVAPVPPFVTASVPARVSVPLDVIGPPLNVRPVVPPVALTEVTLPPPEPAPMAVRKVAASSALTVLSALMRGKVMALGFVSVKKLSPTVVAPRPVRAALVVVAPVPPFVTASVPARVNVPVPVTGPPLNVRPVVPPVALTEVTVPAPIAVRKVAASSVLTVLFALMRGKVMALGFVRVKKLSPTVVEPRLVRAPAAVLEPVPPERIGSALPSVSDVRWVATSTTFVPLL